MLGHKGERWGGQEKGEKVKGRAIQWGQWLKTESFALKEGWGAFGRSGWLHRGNPACQGGFGRSLGHLEENFGAGGAAEEASGGF